MWATTTSGTPRLSDGDTLALLGLCDVVDVVSSSGPVLDVLCEGQRIGIGMTPYGQAIPGSVRGGIPDVDRQIWFTHHDIAFEGSTYPGALPPFAVEGCDVLINGHIHKTQKADAGRSHPLAQSRQHHPSIGGPPRPPARAPGSWTHPANSRVRTCLGHPTSSI